MKVMETEDPFSKSTTSTVRRKGHVTETHDWLKEGLVLINGEGGKGLDIFFSLNSADQFVLVHDQRKRDSNNLGSKSVINLLQRTAIESPNIPNSNIITCLYSCFASPNVSTSDLINDSIIVTYIQSKKYFGSFWLHPAASPLININNTSVTYLVNLLSGKNSNEAAKCLTQVKENYKTIDEVDQELQMLNLGVTWRENAKDRIIFY
jgi:hypothetical protein